MIEIGKYNTLTILRDSPHGLFLDGENLGDILLPKRYVTGDEQIDDSIEVFIYRDSEDRLVATNEKPFACVNEMFGLRVNSITNIGAFCDWGVSKELLVPFSEQEKRMKEGQKYLVYIYLDNISERLVGTTKIFRYLSQENPDFQIGDEVDIWTYDENDIGFLCVVNNQFKGLLYKNETFKAIEIGEKYKAYIKQQREDGKIDLQLEPSGYEKIDSMSQKILDILKERNGYLPVSDKSSPELINKLLGMSKKNFKKSVGYLYKKQLINIEKLGIRLND